MAELLRCKAKELADHWASVRLLLARVAGLEPSRLLLEASGNILEQSVAWADDRDETAQRNLGIATRVIPLDEHSQDGVAPGWWLSWYEKWRPIGQKSKVEFDSTGVTFFYGLRGQRKAQVLRAEWVGPDTTGTFDGKHAAHPHWHVDAPIWAAVRDSSEQPSAYEGSSAPNDTVFLDDSAEESVHSAIVPHPFSADGDSEFALSSSSITLDLSKLHLAMVATWQNLRFVAPTGALNAHQISPENVSMIQNWLSSTCAYAALELRRAANQ